MGEKPQSIAADVVALYDDLSGILTRQRLSVEAFQSRQVVLVQARQSRARVCLYEARPTGWVRALQTEGFVGRSGVSAHRREGDGTTPLGVYRLGFAFGNEEDPGTALAYRNVTQDSYWVSDARSKYYNMWVEGADYRDWTSAEKLSDYPEEYAYAVVVEYNYQPHAVAGRGSAIFLHCGNKPTSGCIAIPRDAMVELLQKLNPQKNPVIVVVEERNRG